MKIEISYKDLMMYAIATCLNQDSNSDIVFFLWCNEKKMFAESVFKKSRCVLEAIEVLKKEWLKDFPQFKRNNIAEGRW